MNVELKREPDTPDLKTVDTPTLQKMLSAGRPTALKIGQAAGARIQVGKKVLWNVRKVEVYLDKIAQ